MLIKMGLLILMSPFPNSCDLIGPAFQQLAQVSRDGVGSLVTRCLQISHWIKVFNQKYKGMWTFTLLKII